MKKAEFQKLLDKPFPIEISPHRGKLLIELLIEALLLLLQFRLASSAGAATQFLSLLNNTIQPAQDKKLILTAEGFEAEPILIRNMFIKYDWKKVSEFKIGKNGFIFFYADKEAQEKRSKIKKFFADQNSSIKNKYAIKTRQLLELLNHCRKRALEEGVVA